MAERAPLFAAAKKKLMARHHIDETEAERAIIRGYLRLAELAGAPVDAHTVTLETIHEAIQSGDFAELEKRAKARTPDLPTRAGTEGAATTPAATAATSSTSTPRSAATRATSAARPAPRAPGGAAPGAAKATPEPRPASAARLDPRRTPASKPPRKP